MNKYILMFSSLLLFGSCNVLDTEDLGSYSPDNVWNDESLVNAYLTDLYAGTSPGGWPINSGSWSDETVGIVTSNSVTADGGGKGFGTELNYFEIRSINLLLESLPEGELSQSMKDGFLGQAYFLRAWNYFEMLRAYGGIPIVDKVLDRDKDELSVKRNTSLECFDFILKDLNTAASLLPVKSTGKSYGRIDQAIVAAFKSRVLLYKASPQFNKTKPYSNSYLTEAYDAAKAAKVLLEANGFGLAATYQELFEVATEINKEVIYPVVFTAPAKVNGRNDQTVRPLSESKNNSGGDVPVWGFLEAYTMKDGKKIGESTKYPYDEQTYWLNRDPRFDVSIVWNASVYELSGKVGRRQYTTSGIAQLDDHFGPNATFGRGVFCRKGMTEELPAAMVTENELDWVEIRFAEVLFNYAEMANEKGEIAEAYTVLKDIRKRAGIEAGSDDMYGLQVGMTKEQMRVALLDEKRIEFSFEDQRYWDLHRHRMLHTVLNGITKHGVLATVKGQTLDEAKVKADKYELMPEEFTYTFPDMTALLSPGSENVMYFTEEFYFYPISKNWRDRNPNMEQTEEWGGPFKCELP